MLETIQTKNALCWGTWINVHSAKKKYLDNRRRYGILTIEPLFPKQEKSTRIYIFEWVCLIWVQGQWLSSRIHETSNISWQVLVLDKISNRKNSIKSQNWNAK